MLDIRSILITLLFIFLSTSIIILFCWQRLKTGFNGLGLIFTDHVLRTVALFLMLLRGIIPDFFSIVVANLTLISSFSFLLAGLQQIFNNKIWFKSAVILNSIFLISILSFTYAYPSLTLRTVGIYSINTVQCFLFCQFLSSRKLYHQCHMVRPVSSLFFLFAFASATRVAVALIEKTEGDFMAIKSIGTYWILIYLVLEILITFAILLLLISMQHEEILQNQKNLHQLVKKRTEQLIQSEKLATLGTLSAGIAHEINNPNNFILMNTELLTRGFNAICCLLPPVKSGVNIHIGNMSYDDFVARIPQIIHDINDGAKRIEHIVSDLKDYTRPPSASNTKFDLSSAASTAAHLNKSLLKKHTKSFHLNLCNESAVVHGDKQKIEQANRLKIMMD